MLNEYGLAPKAPGAVSMTKVKNAFKRVAPDLVLSLRNSRVNGQLQGCTGFVTDPATGRVAYLSTDANHGTNSQALYRTAAHDKDYQGGTNRFCDVDELPERVIDLLREAS